MVERGVDLGVSVLSAKGAHMAKSGPDKNIRCYRCGRGGHLSYSCDNAVETSSGGCCAGNNPCSYVGANGGVLSIVSVVLGGVTLPVFVDTGCSTS